MNLSIQRETTLSVFMPNYNHAAYLPTALDALLKQTLPATKIYIVDDASTDNSRTIIESYALRYPNIIVPRFLNENRGCIQNVKDWLEFDESDFIFIAAADDRIHPTLFEESLTLLRRFPQAGVCSAYSRYMDANGNDLGRFKSWGPLQTPGYITPQEAERFLLARDSWFVGTTTVYRGAILRAQGYDAILGGFADGFVCRVMALRGGVCFIPSELAHWRELSTGMAAQDLTVPALVHRVLTRATELMRGPYRNLFSDEHIRRWNGRWLFWAVVAIYGLQKKQRRNSLNELLQPYSKSMQVILRFCGLLTLGSNCILGKLAAFLYLRPFDLLPALSRALSRLSR